MWILRKLRATRNRMSSHYLCQILEAITQELIQQVQDIWDCILDDDLQTPKRIVENIIKLRIFILRLLQPGLRLFEVIPSSARNEKSCIIWMNQLNDFINSSQLPCHGFGTESSRVQASIPRLIFNLFTETKSCSRTEGCHPRSTDTQK